LYKTWGKLQQTIFDFIAAYTTTAARIIPTAAHVQPRLTVETVNLLLPGDLEVEGEADPVEDGVIFPPIDVGGAGGAVDKAAVTHTVDAKGSLALAQIS
jgi:hypothetical protein